MSPYASYSGADYGDEHSVTYIKGIPVRTFDENFSGHAEEEAIQLREEKRKAELARMRGRWGR